MARSRQAGFTLMEMLVALVVLGLLLAGLTQGTRFGILAWRHQAAAIARRDQLDAIDRTFRQLLTHVAIADGSGPGKLIFTGELPQAVALTTRRAEMELLVDEDNRLVLRWRPRAHEISLLPRQDPEETVLLRDVEQLRVSYWREPEKGKNEPGGWSDDWSGGGTPRLLKLSLTFRAGDRRQWPDIVVAPSSLGPAG